MGSRQVQTLRARTPVAGEHHPGGPGDIGDLCTIVCSTIRILTRMKKILDITGQVAFVLFLVAIIFFPFETGEVIAYIVNEMMCGFFSQLDDDILDSME